MAEVKVSVQAEPRDLTTWLVLARRLEARGFHALLVGDHPGSGPSPWPALGSAAAVTETLRLGTYVLQTGVREPMHIAADAATLDLLAPGRVLLGLGAGHTPQEWQDIGRQRPEPRERAARLVRLIHDQARRAKTAPALEAGSSICAWRCSPPAGPPTARVGRAAASRDDGQGTCLGVPRLAGPAAGRPVTTELRLRPAPVAGPAGASRLSSSLTWTAAQEKP